MQIRVNTYADWNTQGYYVLLDSKGELIKAGYSVNQLQELAYEIIDMRTSARYVTDQIRHYEETGNL